MSLTKTSARLLTGVPFDIGHSHSRWHESKGAQIRYFEQYSYKPLENCNYIKKEGMYELIVTGNESEHSKCNYIMVKNSNYTTGWFFAFVVLVEYVSHDSTKLYFTIDPFQSRMFDFTVRKSMVVREHTELFYGGDNLRKLTVDEQLDYGKDYETIYTQNYQAYPFLFVVLVFKNPIHNDFNADSISPKIVGSPQTLTYYFIPLDRTKDNKTYYFTGGGGLLPEQFTTVPSWEKMWNVLYNHPKVANNLVNAYISEDIGMKCDFVKDKGYKLSDSDRVTIDSGKLNGEMNIYTPNNTLQFTKKSENMFNIYQKAYEKLGYKNPKMYSSPYLLIEVSTSRGEQLILNPENFTNPNLIILSLGSMNFTSKFGYMVLNYGVEFAEQYRTQLGISNTIIDNNPNDMAIMDDNLSAFLQGNKNSMSAKKATWNDEKQYQQISSAIRGSSNISGGAISNDPRSISESGFGLMQALNNYNYANTDFENKSKEQMAQLYDVKNIPSNIRSQGENNSFDLGHNLSGLRVSLITPRKEYLDKINDFLNVYGTKVNDFKVPNLHTRKNFNYVKTSMCNITGNIYNDEIIKIKEIFDKGITLWHTDDIYNYDVANEVI